MERWREDGENKGVEEVLGELHPGPTASWRSRAQLSSATAYTYIFIHIYSECACVCVCLCTYIDFRNCVDMATKACSWHRCIHSHRIYCSHILACTTKAIFKTTRFFWPSPFTYICKGVRCTSESKSDKCWPFTPTEEYLCTLQSPWIIYVFWCVSWERRVC